MCTDRSMWSSLHSDELELINQFMLDRYGCRQQFIALHEKHFNAIGGSDNSTYCSKKLTCLKATIYRAKIQLPQRENLGQLPV